MLVIGTGRLGRTILRSFGDLITGVVTSQPAVASGIGSAPPLALYDRLEHVPMEHYDMVWLAVPDRAIPEVAAQAAAMLDDWSGKIVLHSSGATSLAPLEPFKERGGAAIGVLHPNAILSGDDPFPHDLVWGITLDGLPRHRVEDLLAPFSPKLIEISDDLRPLYHAAASVAANYSMVLFAVAATLYQEAGVDPELAGEIVARFMEEGVRVAAAEGLADGLTGPVARRDVATVEGHLAAIGRHAPELLDLITELVRTAARMMQAKEFEKIVGGR